MLQPMTYVACCSAERHETDQRGQADRQRVTLNLELGPGAPINPAGLELRPDAGVC